MLKKILLTIALTISLASISASENINFEHSEMRIIQPESWLIDHNYDNVYEALVEYHETEAFVQTPEEYKTDPSFYFKRRMQALDHLQETVDQTIYDHPLKKSLQKQIKKKRKYLAALPSPDVDGPMQRIKAISQTEPLQLLDKYWIEFLDPLHRTKATRRINEIRWRSSDVPNYFIFMETVENDPLMNEFAPQDGRVSYFTDQQKRDPHKVYFIDGLAYMDGAPLDTRNYSSKRFGEHIGTFVMGLDGHLYVYDINDGSFHHSSVFSGGGILTAGEISAVEGVIKTINNLSGHYRPSGESLLHALALIRAGSGTLEDILVHSRTNDGFYFAFEGQDFYKNGSAATPLPIGEYYPLHFAIANDHFAWSYLTDDPEQLTKEFQGKTPFQFAATLGKIEWIELFINANAALGKINYYGTPLELAAASGDIPSIERLYEVTTNPTTRANALLHAAKSGKRSAIEYFANKGLSFTHQDNYGNTIFHYAVSAPSIEAFEYLLEKKELFPLLYKKNYQKETALHRASASGCRALVERLLSMNFSALDKDSQGNTPYHTAAKNGNFSTLKALIDNGANEHLATTNSEGAIPLHYAAGTLELDDFKVVFDAYPAANSQDRYGETPLFYNQTSPDKDSIFNASYLLYHGADASIKNVNGLTVAHKAAISKNWKQMTLVFTFYNGMYDETPAGDTPLQLAIKAKNKGAIKFLSAHADLKLLLKKNVNGEDAFDLADLSSDDEIIEYVNSLNPTCPLHPFRLCSSAM